MSRLRTKLREVSRKTGDIRTNVYKYIVLPHFDRYAKAHVSIGQLRQGNTSTSGRTYPSSQYGWLVNIITRDVVEMIIRANKNNIVSADIRNRRYYDANNMASFKRVFATYIRRWWALNKDKLLPTWDSRMDGILQNNAGVQTYVNVAIREKANNRSVPQQLRSESTRVGRSTVLLQPKQ